MVRPATKHFADDFGLGPVPRTGERLFRLEDGVWNVASAPEHSPMVHLEPCMRARPDVLWNSPTPR